MLETELIATSAGIQVPHSYEQAGLQGCSFGPPAALRKPNCLTNHRTEIPYCQHRALLLAKL